MDPADSTVQRFWDGDGYVGQPLPADTNPAGDFVAADQTAAPPDMAITFRGRLMRVGVPSPEQLAVWQNTATRLAKMDADGACTACRGIKKTPACPRCDGTGKFGQDETARLLGRAVSVIISVLAEQSDRDWVEDGLLAGDFDLVEAGGIVTETVTVYRANNTTSSGAAPRTGPVARRRR